MKPTFRAISWVILLISLALPAYFYHSLPGEVLIARSFFGGETVLAPKSLFTVFRVPFIEIVCALAIELMRRKFALANPDYDSMWSILFCTVALKSLLQAVEIVSPENFAKLFFYLTLAVVIGGIITSIYRARNLFSNFFRGDWEFSYPEKAILFALLMVYLGLAIVPIFIFG